MENQTILEMHQQVDQVILKNVSLLRDEEITAIVDRMSRDMKFYAICYIIYGGFISLTIFGAILGIPMIIYNLRLKDSAEQYRKFIHSKDFYQLNRAFESQRKFFFFNKVLLIIGLVGLAIYLVMIVLFGLTLFSVPATDFVRI